MKLARFNTELTFFCFSIEAEINTVHLENANDVDPPRCMVMGGPFCALFLWAAQLPDIQPLQQDGWALCAGYGCAWPSDHGHPETGLKLAERQQPQKRPKFARSGTEEKTGKKRPAHQQSEMIQKMRRGEDNRAKGPCAGSGCCAPCPSKVSKRERPRPPRCDKSNGR